MTQILIGDTDPYRLYEDLTGRSILFNEFIVEEQKLLNLYAHNVKDGAAVIRTATKRTSSSWLVAIGLQDKIEVCYNLAVNKARQASAGKDILLGGVIAPGFNWNWNDRHKIEREVSEAIIMLDDFEVDFLLLEGFSNIDQLSKITALSAKLSDLPLAVFLKVETKFSAMDIAMFNELANNYQLELCGLECSSQNFKQLNNLPKNATKGILAMDANQITTFEWKQLFKTGVRAVFGGMNSSRKDWQKALKIYQQIIKDV